MRLNFLLDPMEGEGKAVASRVPPCLRAYGSLHTEATGCDHEAEVPTYEWLDIDDGSRRKRRSTLRRAAGILGVVLFLGVAASATYARWTMNQGDESSEDGRPMRNTMFQVMLAMIRSYVFSVYCAETWYLYSAMI